MAKLKFIRCKHIIVELAEDGNHQIKPFFYKDREDKERPSISAAKRESRRLQQANGGLGMGSLKIVQSMKELENLS